MTRPQFGRLRGPVGRKPPDRGFPRRNTGGKDVAMTRDFRAKLGLAVALSMFTTPLAAQVFEREAEITGPGGRTIQRQVRRERAPGQLTRELTIQRPGGTLHR